ncbi:MAG: dihydrolipoamide acetyltransferase family protein [Solirubrobacteraceae bacterium]
MITPVVMPQLGLEVTEGTVAAIRVAVGATVAEGDTLVELETDKALTDVIAPRAGVVARISVEEGETVVVGSTLVIIADELGEQFDVTAGGPDRVRSAPVARRAAVQLGIELSSVVGTGPRGRITLADVEQAAADRPGSTAPAVNGAGAEPVALSATRRGIARRMTQSQAIPQFSLQRELDVTRLLADKAALRDPAPGSPKSTITDMLVQALGEVVSRHPALATTYVESDTGEAMVRRRPGADVGLAVATDRGLTVPVIRGSHERALHELAADRVRLVGLARSGRLTLEQMSGAAVTLSNLGSFGVDRFVAMLNPGEAAILAVGRVLDRVVARGRGIEVAPMLTLTLTVDHRVIDGAGGGAALADLAALLEGAMTWRP